MAYQYRDRSDEFGQLEISDHSLVPSMHLISTGMSSGCRSVYFVSSRHLLLIDKWCVENKRHLHFTAVYVHM